MNLVAAGLNVGPCAVDRAIAVDLINDELHPRARVPAYQTQLPGIAL